MRKNKRLFLFCFIVFCCVLILPILPLFQQGLPVTHDGKDHVVRIANFYQSLREGTIVPRWGNNLNWGFGHPVLMFLYPLPSYGASVFHSLGLDLIDSTKMVFAVSFVLSGLACFWFAKEQWGDFPGIIAGLLYSFAPYRFIDMSVRGALGEHVAFIFLPLVLLGIKKIACSQYKLAWSLFLSVSITGLLLSHNAVSLMIIPVALSYFFYIVKFESHNKKQFVFYVVYASILALALSSFFVLPAFFEGKYTLRDIVTKNEIFTRMVPFTDFIYSSWNYGGGAEFSKQIGIIHWIFILASCVFVVRTKKKQEKILGGGLLILLFLSLFMMTPVSTPVWKIIPIIQKFQFPWRILTITVLLSALLGGYSASFISHKRQFFLFVITVIALILTTFSMWKPKSFQIYTENFFTDIYSGTTDTGESSPIWSVRFMEYSPAKPIEFIEGSGRIEEIDRSTTSRRYTITSDSSSRLVENTLYFPGWKVFVNGNIHPVEFQDPAWRGRMTFTLPEGTFAVAVLFGDTKFRMIANYITLFGIGVFITSCMVLLFPRKKIL